MARLIAHAVLFVLGMHLIERLNTLGNMPALAFILSWSRLWAYVPFCIAAAAALRGWRRAIPLLVADAIGSALIASPTSAEATAPIIAPILLGFGIGSAVWYIAIDGGTHASRPTRPADR